MVWDNYVVIFSTPATGNCEEEASLRERHSVIISDPTFVIVAEHSWGWWFPFNICLQNYTDLQTLNS